jgi:transcription elongation GreA/GreB family factor
MYSVISRRKIKSAPNSSKQVLNRESDLDINENSDEISDEQYEEVINERCTSVGSKVKLYYIKEDITLSLIISEHTNKADNKNLHYKMPLAIALYNKEAGSIIKFKKSETDLNFVYVEVLDVDNSDVKETEKTIINTLKTEKLFDSLIKKSKTSHLLKTLQLYQTII